MPASFNKSIISRRSKHDDRSMLAARAIACNSTIEHDLKLQELFLFSIDGDVAAAETPGEDVPVPDASEASMSIGADEMVGDGLSIDIGVAASFNPFGGVSVVSFGVESVALAAGVVGTWFFTVSFPS